VLADAGILHGSVETTFIASYQEFGKHPTNSSGQPLQPGGGSQPVIVVPAQPGRSRLALVGGWLLAAMLVVALVGVVWSHRSERGALEALQAAYQQYWADMTQSATTLLESDPLPQDPDRRRRILTNLIDVVESVPRSAPGSDNLNTALHRLEFTASSMRALENAIAKAEADPLQSPTELIRIAQENAEVAGLYRERIDRVKRKHDQVAGLTKELDQLLDTTDSQTTVASLDQLESLENKLGALESELNKNHAVCEDYRRRIADVYHEYESQQELADSVVARARDVLNEINRVIRNQASPDSLVARAAELEDAGQRLTAAERSAGLAEATADLAALIDQLAVRTADGKAFVFHAENVELARKALMGSVQWLREYERELKERRDKADLDETRAELGRKLHQIKECRNKLRNIEMFFKLVHPRDYAPSGEGPDPTAD
jgi:hypothetical protein